MSDCEKIEKLIGRELTAIEMCDCGISRLEGESCEEIADRIKATDRKRAA